MVWFILMILMLTPRLKGEPQVPCYFIFGDSAVDNGNNNNLTTTAKANYPPYGIDFPTGPNGRFTNGRNKADFLAELLGFDSSIPPFATARGSEILKGVNYGSGVSGILQETGYHWVIEGRKVTEIKRNKVKISRHATHFGQSLIQCPIAVPPYLRKNILRKVRRGDRISMTRQLQNHQITISKIISILNGNVTSAEGLLSKCLYTVDIGNNDYLQNFLQPKYYSTSHMYTADQFAELLLQQFSIQLKNLYSYGARKVAVSNIGMLGCSLEVVEDYGRNAFGCVDIINNYVQMFNEKLKNLVDDLNTNLPDARFIYINQTSIVIADPFSHGVTVLGSACCSISQTIAKGQCLKDQVPCMNTNQHLFFDNYHFTEVAAYTFTRRSYNAFLPSDTYPTDISHLLQTL